MALSSRNVVVPTDTDAPNTMWSWTGRRTKYVCLPWAPSPHCCVERNLHPVTSWQTHWFWNRTFPRSSPHWTCLTEISISGFSRSEDLHPRFSSTPAPAVQSRSRQRFQRTWLVTRPCSEVTGHSLRAETSTWSLRFHGLGNEVLSTSSVSFVHETGSELQVHADKHAHGHNSLLVGHSNAVAYDATAKG